MWSVLDTYDDTLLINILNIIEQVRNSGLRFDGDGHGLSAPVTLNCETNAVIVLLTLVK